MTFELVEDQMSFDRMMSSIAGQERIALDTEAASFHRFHDRIYLIQLSTAELTWVIDPLAVSDLAPLARLMADPAVEVIFHDADYDLRLFYKEYGFEVRGLFDTRVSAQLLGLASIGLGSLLEEHFGLKPDKRFQRADWSLRPLTPGMLDYAAGDTSHLVELRNRLRTKLLDLGRLSWAEEEFRIVTGNRWEPGSIDPRQASMKMKGARALDRRGLALLGELYAWRDSTASELDRAGFRVMGNEVLLSLAANPVADPEALARVRGVGSAAVTRWGEAILAAIRRGQAVVEDELPRFERGQRRPVDPEFDGRIDRLKLVRNRAAEQLALQPGVLCPNGTLEQIARINPGSLEDLAGIEPMRNWQRDAIGVELLAALKATGEPSG